MAGRFQHRIKDWTIRRKILSGFTVVLLLSVLLGWQALQGLQRLTDAISSGQQTPAGIQRMFQDTRFFIMVILGITIVLGVALALGLARLIADPLTQLGILCEEVSKGVLTIEIKSQSRDEIGWLEHSMRQMVKNLRQIAGQITSSSRAVATPAEKIAASSTEMARGAENQSTSTEETSSTMVEIAAQMQLLARNAEALAANVDQTSASIQQMSATLSQTARNGEILLGAVEQATSTLGTMISNVGSIANRVHQVDEMSQQSVAETRQQGERPQESIKALGDRADERGKRPRGL